MTQVQTTLNKKQISHYLRSRIISIHSSISLVLLKTQDPELKQELQMARDVYVQEQLSRVDLLYYSLLGKEELDYIIRNVTHEGIYKNIQMHSYKKRFLSRIHFLLDTMTHLVEKMDITSHENQITCNIYVQDHNDDLLTVHLFITCLGNVLSIKNVHLSKEDWGYELQFEI